MKTNLADVLLLLVELVDDLILVGNLVIERPDSVVTGSFLLSQFLDDNLQVSDIFLDSGSLLLQSFLVVGGINSGLLSLGQLVSGASQGNLQVGLLAGDLGLSLVILAKVALLGLDLLDQSFLLVLNDLVLIQQLGLQVDLLLVHSVGGVGLFLKKSQLLIWIRSSNKRSGLLDDDEPS